MPIQSSIDISSSFSVIFCSLLFQSIVPPSVSIRDLIGSIVLPFMIIGPVFFPFSISTDFPFTIMVGLPIVSTIVLALPPGPPEGGCSLTLFAATSASPHPPDSSVHDHVSLSESTTSYFPGLMTTFGSTIQKIFSEPFTSGGAYDCQGPYTVPSSCLSDIDP